MQIMTTKTTTRQKLYVHVVLSGVIFLNKFFDIVSYARDFLPVKFSLKY